MEIQRENLGRVLDGKYRIERAIGAGGMGVVCEATHLHIGRKVAIKTLLKEHLGNREFLVRFKREAKAAGSIGHDNICEVTDIGFTEEGAPYLVMPLLLGQSLTNVIKSGSLTLRRICDIMRQTLSALQAAHSANIIHRDLKPSNILITKVGDREDFVKLLDFGISKSMGLTETMDLTKSGIIPGTPRYMAPEQAEGSKHIDHKVDIYAAGVILYEMLTKERPFDGSSHNEILIKIVSKPFKAPRAIDPTIPVEIEKVVLKAMARDPYERYATAEAMREDLSRAAAVPAMPSRAPEEEKTVSTTRMESETPLGCQVNSGRGRLMKRPSLITALLLAIIVALSVVVSIGYYQRFAMDKRAPEEAAPAAGPLRPAADEPAPKSQKIYSEPAAPPLQETQPEQGTVEVEQTEKMSDVKIQQSKKKKKRAQSDLPETPTMIEGEGNTNFISDYGE